jgi:hypothetical protein
MPQMKGVEWRVRRSAFGREGRTPGVTPTLRKYEYYLVAVVRRGAVWFSSTPCPPSRRARRVSGLLFYERRK